MEQSFEIRRLKNASDAEIQRLVDIVFEAFNHAVDPLVDMVVAGDRSLLPLKFESQLRAAAVGGEVDIAFVGPDVKDIIGVAVWFGPGQEFLGTEDQRAAAGSLYFEQAPEEVRKWRAEQFIPALERLSNNSLGSGFKLKNWSLMLLAVDPAHHRKGIAKTLVGSVEEEAKKHGLSIVLETSTELDLSIYSRLGFLVKGEVTVSSPWGQCPVWQMVKVP